MTDADRYRGLAADCEAKAVAEPSPELKVQWEFMARSYRLLAEQADRNAAYDIVYETPPERSQVVQQQQQPQPKKDDK